MIRIKKGFTLIELLAVIVILAIIALIATPLILNVIDEARKGAFKDSAYGMLKAAEFSYTQNILDGTKEEVIYTYTAGVESANISGKTLNYKGTKPQSGTVIINDDGKIALAIFNGTHCAEKGYDDIEVTLTDKTAEECTLEIPIPEITLSFGGGGSDSFDGVVLVSGGYVVVGKSASADGDLSGLNNGGEDGIIVKYDLEGNIIWKKNFGGSADDQFKEINLADDGFIVAGSSSSTDGDLTGLNNGGGDGIIVKYDFDGNVVWKDNYGGSLGDTFGSVTVTNDGYIAVGYSNSINGDLSGLNKGTIDGIIVKYDLNGNVLWKRNYGGGSGDYFSHVAATLDGCIVVGQSNSTDGDLSGLNHGSTDGIIVKYDTSGNVLWKDNYGGSGADYFAGVNVVDDGYVVVGDGNSTNVDLTGLNKGGYDSYIAKYDLSGNVVWNQNYGGSLTDRFYKVDKVSDGYIAVGYSTSIDVDLTGLNLGGADATIVKYDLSGNVEWKENFGGSGSEYPSYVRVTEKGNTIIGYSNSADGGLTNQGGNDAFIKYSNFNQ